MHQMFPIAAGYDLRSRTSYYLRVLDQEKQQNTSVILLQNSSAHSHIFFFFFCKQLTVILVPIGRVTRIARSQTLIINKPAFQNLVVSVQG